MFRLSSPSLLFTGDHSEYDPILLLKIGKYIPGGFSFVPQVLFTMVPPKKCVCFCAVFKRALLCVLYSTLLWIVSVVWCAVFQVVCCFLSALWVVFTRVVYWLQMYSV